MPRYYVTRHSIIEEFCEVEATSKAEAKRKALDYALDPDQDYEWFNPSTVREWIPRRDRFGQPPVVEASVGHGSMGAP